MPLKITKDQFNFITIKNASIYSPRDFLKVNGATKIIAILNEGLDNRTVRETDVNETSSRSITVFAIKII